MSEKIKSVESRTDKKISELEKGLVEFKEYYGKCYEYTISRVNDAYNREQEL